MSWTKEDDKILLKLAPHYREIEELAAKMDKSVHHVEQAIKRLFPPFHTQAEMQLDSEQSRWALSFLATEQDFTGEIVFAFHKGKIREASKTKRVIPPGINEGEDE